MTKFRAFAFALLAFLPTLALAQSDPPPTYNPKNGLTANCRALLMENVRGWRAGKYTAQESMISLERNCGPCGWTWTDASEADKARRELWSTCILTKQPGAADCNVITGIAACTIQRPKAGQAMQDRIEEWTDSPRDKQVRALCAANSPDFAKCPRREAAELIARIAINPIIPNIWPRCQELLTATWKPKQEPKAEDFVSPWENFEIIYNRCNLLMPDYMRLTYKPLPALKSDWDAEARK